MKKRFFAMLLASLLVLTVIVAVPVSAAAAGDWEYTIAGGAATVTGYTGSDAVVTIPSTLGGCPVVSIGDYAFARCFSLIKLTIPGSVTDIGSNAFYLCGSLETINIPNSVNYIGEYAFCGCNSLSSITIPVNAAFVGDGAFYLCDSLSEIKVDAGNSVYTSIDGVLYNKSASFLIAVPGAKTSVTIPASVSSIGVFAFNHCYSLTRIGVDSRNTTFTSIDGVVYNKDVSVLLAAPGAKTSIVIPDSVVVIGEYAFDGCRSLLSVRIPNSVTEIRAGAFAFCSSLAYVVIPDSVTSIGNYAFDGCSSLSSVYYGGTVSEWYKMPLGTGNNSLFTANIIFNSVGPSGSPGDVDGNGKVNAKDIIAVMRHMLGNTPESFVEAAADMDANGKINAKDIIAIMRTMLGG